MEQFKEKFQTENKLDPVGQLEVAAELQLQNDTTSANGINVNSNNKDSSKIIGERHVRFCRQESHISISNEDKLDDPESRTADTPLLEKDLLLAATLVSDAKHGNHSDFEMTDRAVRLYIIYNHWGLRYLLFFFITLHHAIAIFEKPAVTGCELPFWVTMGLETACLLFYLFRLVHSACFLPPMRFWRDKKNLLVIAVMALTVIDMICYVVMTSYGIFTVRWSRPLRSFFIVNFSENRQVRRAFRNIRRTLPDIMNVLFLFFLSILMFSLMALKMFEKRHLKYPNNTPYFSNFLDIFFDLYVLVTTANNPDVMMPAYDFSRWFSIFFIVYLIVCLYIFMNIFLAVVYNNYRKHLKNEVRKMVYMKRQSLSRAFELLKVTVHGKQSLVYKRFHALLKMMKPVRSPVLVSILWFVLDKDGNNVVGKPEFLQLADLLNVGVSEVKDRKNILEIYLPQYYNSRPSLLFRKLVAHRFFRYFFDILIVINAGLIAADKTDVEWLFLGFFTFEIVSKMYTFGFRQFFRRYWNIFDFVVIGSAVVASIIESILEDGVYNRNQILDILMVLRVLRLVKIIGSIDRFQVIVVTIMNLGPSILTYGGVLFVVYYTFAVLGMEIFGTKIKYYGYENVTNPDYMFCGNPRLNGSAFYQNHYCSNNFNNIINSLVLLFELMVVNQWHVLTNGFVLVTSKIARIYFFTFHLVCVIIVMNIFTAFVLEAFILEYSFSKSKLESTIEKKIEEMGLHLKRKTVKPSSQNDKKELVEDLDSELPVDSDHNYQQTATDEIGSDITKRRDSNTPDFIRESDIRFHLSKNKNVENLLQRMFENELEVDDLGPSDIDEVESGYSCIKEMTLDNI